MKTIIILLFTVLILTSCNNNRSNQETKKTVITGQVEDFDEISKHKIIKIYRTDLLESENLESQQINKNGQFRFEFNIKEPIEFNLIYSDYLRYYVFPGDSLHITISSDCWKTVTNTHAEESRFYKITGGSEKMNSDISKFMSIYRDSLVNEPAISDSIKSMEALDFLKFKTDHFNELQKSLDLFNKAENTCPEFRKWAKNHIKYDHWTRLMNYRNFHAEAINEDITSYVTKMPPEYFDFLDKLENARGDEINGETYHHFLHEYTMYVNQMIPLDSQNYIMSVSEDFDKVASFLLRYYNRAETGFLKDVLISKYYYRLLEAKYYAQLKNIFDINLISDKGLRERIQQKYDLEKSLYETPQFSEGTKLNELKNENDFLNTLIKEHPNKVLYIDFWAPWCKPCMNEMSDSKKIKDYFQDKNIAFVYLASNCKEGAWKSTIAEHKIDGEHYLLSKTQSAQLNDIFKITGIPHYVLIDKKGNIVNGDAPRPSSNKELIKLLEKNLQ